MGAAFGAAVTGSARASGVQSPESPMFAAACRKTDGAWTARLLTIRGQIIREQVLPGRGHDATFCPVTRRCVVFARRPGTFAVAFETDRSHAPAVIEAAEGRHFYGHGVFSADGRLLYATENDYEAGRGVIGVYDARSNFARVAEFPSHGLGPHDIALMGHGPVLVVANGGYREHPDFGRGRRILNPEAVESALCYIDTRTGDLIERHTLGPYPRLSLRHLAVAPGGTVAVGAQIEGTGAPGAPLLFTHSRQGQLTSLALDERVTARLSGYVSSVAIDRSGEVLAATSARGGVVLLISLSTGALLGHHAVADVSGVAETTEPGWFMITDGDGGLAAVDDGTGAPTALVQPSRQAAAWDNHLAAETLRR